MTAVACAGMERGIKAGVARVGLFAEVLPELPGEGTDPDGFDGKGAFVVDVEFSSAGGFSNASHSWRLSVRWRPEGLCMFLHLFPLRSEPEGSRQGKRGGHALQKADRLLTRNDNFYSRHFKRLTVIGS